ncbi:MAG: type I-U CRISPR-associated helicase/endonuclease Cas3 [Polyangiaceae bacterium]|nr:type I-U CRISPR-associated helicase/endonuclease Cas3 [Polyangiaceae bacterium]
MTALPSFAEFYEALHGRDPFPWQTRLADQVLAADWPDLLDLPTGTGKTSALDVALYAMARVPERTPRRAILVVDRRIVVEQGAVHARMVCRRLAEARRGPLFAIAEVLRSLFGSKKENGAPFAVAVLRGGAPRDDDWAKRPDQPVLGVSTVDQVGSRLLFRGYGVGPKLASIQAGLMGNDTLILLDEVHLAVPFAQTLRALRGRYMKSQADLPDRFRVVEMSATPTGVRPSNALELSDDDRAHPLIRKRIGAHKPAKLVEVTVHGNEGQRRAKIAKEAAQAARALQAEGVKTIGVVLNRVDTARQVYALLSGEEEFPKVVLVTGRMRPLDRDRVVAQGLIHADASRDRSSAVPVIVVATQCIEAGADLDFDGLITELASLDALKQRFGRLDRRGELAERGLSARSVILARADALSPDADDPIYGTALGSTWRYLNLHAKQQTVDMGVSALIASPPGPEESSTLVSPHTVAPVLLPGHIEAWAQTSPLLRPDPDPDVSLWLHGPQRGAADVQLVWRGDLEVADLQTWADVDERGVERRDEVVSALEMFRPSALEALPLPLHAAKEPVVDLGDLAQLRGRGTLALRLHPASSEWLGRVELPKPQDESTSTEDRETIQEWLQTLPSDPPDVAGLRPAEWKRILGARLRRTPAVLGSGAGPYFAISERLPAGKLDAEERVAEATSEDDASSFGPADVSLRRHSADVRAKAEEFVKTLQIPSAVANDVVLAAWLHDVGKADARFQMVLAGGDAATVAAKGEPQAKSRLPNMSAARRRQVWNASGLPRGYRHELTSLSMIEDNAAILQRCNDHDLVLHLVASHHGWCRPFAPAVAGDQEVREVKLELERPGDPVLAIQGAQARDTLRWTEGSPSGSGGSIGAMGFGDWPGSEAILRLADHRASEEVASTGGTP